LNVADRLERDLSTTPYHDDDEQSRLSQSSTDRRTRLAVGARSSKTNDDKQRARGSIPSLRGGSGRVAQFVLPHPYLAYYIPGSVVALARWRRKSTPTTDGCCRLGRHRRRKVAGHEWSGFPSTPAASSSGWRTSGRCHYGRPRTSGVCKPPCRALWWRRMIYVKVSSIRTCHSQRHPPSLQDLLCCCCCPYDATVGFTSL